MLDDDRWLNPSGCFFTSALLGSICGCSRKKKEEDDDREIQTRDQMRLESSWVRKWG